MKKLIFVILTLAFLLPLFSFDTVATSEFDENKIINQTEDDLFSAMDEDIIDSLHSFGIDGLDFEKIYSVSPKNIADFFSTSLKEKYTEVLESFLVLCCVLLILYAVKTVIGSSNDTDLSETVCAVIMIILCVGKITPVINSVLSAIDLSSKFILSFVPIYAAMIAMCGNPASALTYNTFVLALSEGVSAFSGGMATSIVGAFLALSMCFCFNERINLQRFCSAFNRLTGVTLGVISSFFALVLSVKGVMSSSLDTVSSKGIRLVVSTTLPVIGSAIGQAYSTIVGSLSLIKGSVAAVGIIVLLIINLPVLIFSFLYYASFEVLSFIAQASGFTTVSNVLKAFCSAIRFLMLTEIFEFVLVVISTGLMLLIKAGL